MMVSTPNRRRARSGGKPHVFKHKHVITMAAVQQLLATYGSSAAAPGQVAYTTAGTYSWVCPAGVTSVCVVCVSAAGPTTSCQGNGGNLAWGNNIPVIPGNSYTVYVGSPSTTTATSRSYFINTSTLFAGGFVSRTSREANGGTYLGGGGLGGNGPASSSSYYDGGGGAAGYTGNGGNGATNNSGSIMAGTAGGGGGGGGGGAGVAGGGIGGGGGGVGLLGQGSNGAAGASSPATSRQGFGGSSGTNGGAGSASDGNGGLYGGGGAGDVQVSAGGAVRIIWGSGRAFPSTNTGNV